MFAFSPCSAGPGTVKRVDDPRSAGTERDKSNLLRATDSFYNSLSDSFVKGMVSVDFMIATAGAFMDASCFAPLSSRTGGLCRVFNQFNLATQVLQSTTLGLRRAAHTASYLSITLSLSPFTASSAVPSVSAALCVCAQAWASPSPATSVHILQFFIRLLMIAPRIFSD